MTDQELLPALIVAASLFDARATRGEGFAVGKAAICRDMVRRFNSYGRWASERQRNYALALVRWSQPLPARAQATAERQQAAAEANSERRTAQLMSPPSLERIAQLFAAAALHGLRYPKIRLRRGEWAIRIYPAPRLSRNAGSFYVKARSATAHDLYCGMIRPGSGEFVAHPDCPLDVVEALREFAANPLRVASAYGHAQGHCCFCGRGLTDARSVAMGYGPVCADHFGLEWGEQRAPSRVTLNETERQVERDIQALRDEQEVNARETSEGIARRRTMNPELARRIRHRIATPPWRGGGGASPTPAPATPLDPEDEDSHFM